MRIVNRIISLALLLVLASLVAGCSSINIPSWDPTDLLDFLDTKKKAPGERHPVFPSGVPGVAQGVPPDLVKGTPEHTAAMAAVDPSLAPPPTDTPVEPEKPKKRVAAKPTRVTVTPHQPEPNGEDAADTEEPPPASPPPPRKRTAKKPAGDQSAASDQSQAAPQPQQTQPALSAAPTVPSGSFQR